MPPNSSMPEFSPYLNVRLNPMSGNLCERLRGIPLHRWLRAHYNTTVEPIFPHLDLASASKRRGIHTTLERLVDWHRVQVHDPDAVQFLYERLQKMQWLVRDVQRVPWSPGLPAPAISPAQHHSHDQDFRREAPFGVGADRVQIENPIPGAMGDTVRIADIEHGWDLDGAKLRHPDLPKKPIWYDGEPNVLGFANHGTRVLGVLSAIHQSPPMDVRGLTTPRRLVLLGNLRPGPALGFDIQTTDTQLGNTLDHLDPGDVVLVEAQTTAGGRVLPAEADITVFEAIIACVARGITVVAAAGNGNISLPDIKDSGSILVAGARRNASDTGWERADQTNYGERINCFAEGENVTTTAIDNTIGPLDPHRYKITTGFGGTSSAAAIIAGVAASVQGMARAKHGRALRPEALRNLLSDPANGTESIDTPAGPQQIGVMPDLERLAGALPAFPDPAYL